jgi:5-methyltetrahydrofolate corrinoid/iron sulfur protein methyltransferase
MLNISHMRLGMQPATVDCFDTKHKDITPGKYPNLLELVHNIKNGEAIDMSKLSKEEVDCMKTAKVILGHSLYSDSWLEV